MPFLALQESLRRGFPLGKRLKHFILQRSNHFHIHYLQIIVKSLERKREALTLVMRTPEALKENSWVLFGGHSNAQLESLHPRIYTQYSCIRETYKAIWDLNKPRCNE